MAEDSRTPPPADDKDRERPCWREMLHGALAGINPLDDQLERFIDHLEKTR